MRTGIVGWAQLPFEKHTALDLEGPISQAAKSTIAHAGIDGNEIEGIWIGNLNDGFVPDIFCSPPAVKANNTLSWKPVTRIKNAYEYVHWTASGQASLMTLVGGLGTLFGPIIELAAGVLLEKIGEVGNFLVRDTTVEWFNTFRESVNMVTTLIFFM